MQHLPCALFPRQVSVTLALTLHPGSDTTHCWAPLPEAPAVQLAIPATGTLGGTGGPLFRCLPEAPLSMSVTAYILELLSGGNICHLTL